MDSADFYKHISATLPEAHRTRHLLVYCSKRALDVANEKAAKEDKDKAKGKSSKSRDKGKDFTRTAEGDKIVDEIMEAFLSGLGKGDVETNVFDVSVCLYLCTRAVESAKAMSGRHRSGRCRGL